MSNTVSVDLETLYPVMLETLNSGNSFTFSPKGKSMLPLIRQGVDSVKISPICGKLNKYDLPLYRRSNGQFVLHRVVGVSNDKYIMCGDNQFIYEYGIEDSQLIGLVTEIIKPEGIIRTSDKSYISYCRKRVFTQLIKRYFSKVKSFIKKVLVFLHLYK